MFTGIIEEIGTIKAIGSNRLTVAALTALEGTKIGDSIDTDGVCLTVVQLGAGAFSAEVMPETLSRTSLGGLHSGDTVNLERSFVFGGRVGGHIITGHVDCTARITGMRRANGEERIEIIYPEEFYSLVVEKGSIAVDGISLTVAQVSRNSFQVALTPFTAKSTTLGAKLPGNPVNLEFDLIGKYVDAHLSRKTNDDRLSKLLMEGGY